MSLWLLRQSTMEYDDTEAYKVPFPVIVKKSQQNSKSALNIETPSSSQNHNARLKQKPPQRTQDSSWKATS